MKDPLNNMDPKAQRVVHIKYDDSLYLCGRYVRMVMWGSQDVAAGKLPTCLQCLAASPFLDPRLREAQ